MLILDGAILKILRLRHTFRHKTDERGIYIIIVNGG